MVVPVFLFFSTTSMIYAQAGLTLVRLGYMLTALPVLFAALLIIDRSLDRRWAQWAFYAVAGTAIATLIAARVSVLFISPHPVIDVWTSSVKAVNYFLSGANPYAGQYDDIYGGRYAYFPSFPYLPAFLLWASGWAAVFGGGHDVRISLVIAEALTVVPVVLLYRRLQVARPLAVTTALAWLAMPASLFIVEQSWIDPLMIFFFAVTFWALEDERPVAAGIGLALACGVKQYAPLAAVLIAIYAWRKLGRPRAVRAGIAFGVVTAALFLPFLAWDPQAFIRSVVSAWSDQAPRPDSLSLPAMVIELENLVTLEAMRSSYAPFVLATPIVWAGTAWWLWRRPTLRFVHLSLAITACYALIFLCAKQAFANYWGFMAFFALLSCTAAVEPEAPAPAPALSQG
jgi:uncharacterized membrane protein